MKLETHVNIWNINVHYVADYAIMGSTTDHWSSTSTLLSLINGGSGINGGVCKFWLLWANFRGRGVKNFGKKVFFGLFSRFYIWIFAKKKPKLCISRNLSSNFASKIPKINKRPPRLFGSVEYDMPLLRYSTFYMLTMHKVLVVSHKVT